MGGGHHGGKPYEVPDWRIYKVEDVPELKKVQDMLAQKGLKDPWLRNEVWRYHPSFGTKWQRFFAFTTRGIGWGFGAAVITVILTQGLGFFQYQLPAHGHDHGNGHANDHH